MDLDRTILIQIQVLESSKSGLVYSNGALKWTTTLLSINYQWKIFFHIIYIYLTDMNNIIHKFKHPHSVNNTKHILSDVKW